MVGMPNDPGRRTTRSESGAAAFRNFGAIHRFPDTRSGGKPARVTKSGFEGGSETGGAFDAI